MSDDVRNKLTALWGEILDSEINDDSDFFECGGTSIDAVYLAAGIQESFGVAVDAIEVVIVRKFHDLASLISSRLDESSVACAGDER